MAGVNRLQENMLQYGHDDHPERTPEERLKPPVQAETIQRAAGVGIGVGSLLMEHFLSHPCIVLRRQCQINNRSHWNHLTPFTLLPICIQLPFSQGPGTLWKGIGSTFVLKGLAMTSEAIISETTNLPKEVSRYSSFKRIGQHVILKSLSYLFITPFYAASLVETVQSDIASDAPGLLDMVREGVARIVGGASGSSAPPSPRLLPLYVLAPPTVAYLTAHYCISALIQHHVTLQRKHEARELLSVHAQDRQAGDGAATAGSAAQVHHETLFPELFGAFTGHLWADVLLYPLETVLHRLHVQGTRTIIDNVDITWGAPLEVTPISTRYEGVVDCASTIYREEGVAGGFYKGFGAVLLQYMLQYLMLRATKAACDWLIRELVAAPPTRRRGSTQERFSLIGGAPRYSSTIGRAPRYSGGVDRGDGFRGVRYDTSTPRSSYVVGGLDRTTQHGGTEAGPSGLGSLPQPEGAVSPSARRRHVSPPQHKLVANLRQ